MKKLLLLTAATGLVLSAQTPESLPTPLTGVSEAFRTYAARNLGAAVPAVDDDDDELNPNILYLPKPATNPSRITTNTVTAPVSGMYTQTSGGTLPVTVAGNFQGLGEGFP